MSRPAKSLSEHASNYKRGAEAPLACNIQISIVSNDCRIRLADRPRIGISQPQQMSTVDRRAGYRFGCSRIGLAGSLSYPVAKDRRVFRGVFEQFDQETQDRFLARAELR